MNINFSKFKKIDCDGSCTTLEHPGGHVIKIARKKLSPDMQKELDELPVHKAVGGPIGKGPLSAASSEQHSRNSKPSKASMPMPNAAYTPPKKAEHAFTEPDNGGTKPPQKAMEQAFNRQGPPFGPIGMEKPAYPPCINPSCKSYGHSHPNCRCYGGKSGQTHEDMRFAEGGEVDSYCSQDRSHDEGCEYFRAGGMAGEDLMPMESEQGAPVMPETTPQPMPSPAPDQAAVQSQEPQPGAPTPTPLPAPDDWQGSVGHQEAHAPQPEQQAEPMSAPQPVTPVQKFQMQKQQDMGQLQAETHAFDNDLNSGHITPKTYHDLFESKSTLGKLGTIFGLIVGGAGAGLTHGPNMLMDMMKRELDKDFEAQVQSAGNRQNFLKINQQDFMNKAQARNLDVDTKTKAYALTRIQMNQVALHKLVTDTQKLPPGSPQRVQAEQTLALLSDSVNSENYNIADKAAMKTSLSKMLNKEGGSNTTLMKTGVFGPAFQRLGEDVEQKTVDGLPGQASRPIPQEKRDQITSMDVLDKKAGELIKFSKAHEGSMSPSTRATAQQMANELVGFYSNSLGTTMTQGNRTWLDEQVAKKNPTSVISQELMGSTAKLEEIKRSNALRRKILVDSLGLKGGGGSGGKSTSQPDQGGSQTAMKNGKQYKKVNGGWAPVK